MKAEIKEKSIQGYVEDVQRGLEKSRKQVLGAPIEDDKDYDAVCSLLFELAERKKEVTAKEDEVVGPAKQIIAAVQSWFKPLKQALAAHEEDLKARVREYNIERETDRAKLLRDATRLAKVDPKAAREMISRAEAVLPPKVKGIAFVGKLEVKVVDESKIPEEFFRRVVDVAKLQAAAEAGELDPKKHGVLIVDNRTVRVTASQSENKTKE